MVAINAKSVDSTFLSHSHILYQDRLKQSPLLSVWNPYSLRKWTHLSLQEWTLSHHSTQSTFTCSHPISSFPFFTKGINFSLELLSIPAISISSHWLAPGITPIDSRVPALPRWQLLRSPHWMLYHSIQWTCFSPYLTFQECLTCMLPLLGMLDSLP